MRQGAATSPSLFNLIIDELLYKVLNSEMGYSINRIPLSIFAFADDLILIARSEEEANRLLDLVSE